MIGDGAASVEYAGVAATREELRATCSVARSEGSVPEKRRRLEEREDERRDQAVKCERERMAKADEYERQMEELLARLLH